ncbi:MAG: S-methyl-5'-thioadenosine phosphorylase [Myxococcales bacterium]
MGALGIVGGSGIYDMEGLTHFREVRVRTPFGDPSGSYLVGRLGDLELCFLPRHGRGHRLMPSEVNSRANIWGFKRLGVERLVSITAVGSLREELAPGDVVVPDQLFDRTGARQPTFFGGGLVAHVQLADPTCRELADVVYASATAAGGRAHRGGCHLCMEGPSFSTRAESRLHRQWGMDVVGMTVLPEAALAREAELCFANLALVTDYDCWHEVEADVSVPAVLEVLRANARLAKDIVRLIAEKVGGPRTCGCATALDGALVTDPAAVPAATRRRLALLLGDRHAAPGRKVGRRPRAKPKAGAKSLRRTAAAHSR